MTTFENLLILVGRIFIGFFFLWGGVTRILYWKSSAEYMQSKKIPTSLLPAVILLQLIGGLSVFAGFEARIGTLLLIVFLIPSAIKTHDFWNLQGPDRAAQKTLFMKDLAILGGLLLLLATGAGRFAFN